MTRTTSSFENLQSSVNYYYRNFNQSTYNWTAVEPIAASNQATFTGTCSNIESLHCKQLLTNKYLSKLLARLTHQIVVSDLRLQSTPKKRFDHLASCIRPHIDE